MNNGKVRIYELSKELNLDNKDIKEICEQLNIAVKSHSSTITASQADRVKAIAAKSPRNNQTNSKPNSRNPKAPSKRKQHILALYHNSTEGHSLKEQILKLSKELDFSEKDVVDICNQLNISLHKFINNSQIEQIKRASKKYNSSRRFSRQIKLIINSGKFGNYQSDKIEKISYKEDIKVLEKSLELKPNQHDVLNLVGNLCHELKHYGLAIRAWERSLKYQPNQYEIFNKIGDLCKDLGYRHVAISAWEKSLDVNFHQYDIYNKIGNNFLELEDLKSAVKAWERSLELQPNQYEIFNKIGNTHQKLENFESAIKAWEKSLELQQDQYEICDVIGNTYLILGNHLGAILAWEKSLEINSDHCEMLLINLGYIHNEREVAVDYWLRAAILLFNSGNIQEVIENCDTIIRYQKDNYDAWYLKAKSLAKLKSYKESILSIDEVIKARLVDYEICSTLTNNLIKLSKLIINIGDYKIAILYINKATNIYFSFYEPWIEKSKILVDWSKALIESQQWDEANIKLNEALDINYVCFEAWNCLGLLEKPKENWIDALDNFDEAININPNYQEAWTNRIEVISKILKLHDYNPIIESCKKATQINENNYESWFFWGSALSYLKRYEEAIAKYDKALEINSEDNSECWYEKGQALLHLSSYAEAISCYNQALEKSPDYYLALNGKGNALKSQERKLGHRKDSLEAIECFQKVLKITNNSYWRSWRNMGLTYQYLDRYRKALECWDNGLKYIRKDDDDYDFGRAIINYSKAKYQFKEGRKLKNIPYLLDAKQTFEEAIKFYTKESFRGKYVEILEFLVRVIEILIRELRGRGRVDQSDKLLVEGMELLDKLLSSLSNNNQANKIKIARRFVTFHQYNVDKLVQSTNHKDWIKALEMVEERKNLCLHWMSENRWIKKDFNSPNYSAIQTLLSQNQKTAIIYFHISPDVISTFIIRAQHQYPIIITSSSNQFQKFFKWIKLWKRDYVDYRSTTIEGQNSIWRLQLSKNLDKLAETLNITSIVSNLGDKIKELIVIPHRDLQLLPLHYLFAQGFAQRNDNLNVTYLPSAKIGINLKNSPANSNQQMLIVENYDTGIGDKKNSGKKTKTFRYPSSRLLYPEVEASFLSQLYKSNYLRISGLKATKNKVIEALDLAGNFVFTGHGYHNLENPQDSFLAMKEGKITLKDILKLDLRNYFLVCLSACESGITSSHRLMDEYVGLVSGFLAVGTKYVISTLWTVDDVSSALLMMKFHHLYKEDCENPVVALSKAQSWLKNITHQELSEHYLKIANELPRNERSVQRFLREEAEWVISPDNLKFRNSKYPYADPYYWAGFTVTSKVGF